MTENNLHLLAPPVAGFGVYVPASPTDLPAPDRISELRDILAAAEQELNGLLGGN